MAVSQNIQLRVDLKANGNQKSDYFGHLYPSTRRVSTLDLRGFCQHMAEHNTIYGRDVVTGVLTLMQGCLYELLSQGVAVKLDGIGIFSPSLKSIKGGAKDLAEAKKLGPDALVQGVKVNFRPDGTKLDNYTSKKMKEICSLRFHQLAEVVSRDPVTKKPVYKYTDISDATAQADSGTGSGD